MDYFEGNKFYKKEIIDGKSIYLLPARPEHVVIVRNLSYIFNDYFKTKDNNECDVYPDGMFLYIEGKKQRLVPDLMVICDNSKFINRGYKGVPELIVEVISRSTFDYDIGRKKEIYEEIGVKEYWIINPYFKDVRQYALKNNKYELLGKFFIGEELDEYGEEIYSDEKFKTFIFPDLEVRIEDLFKSRIVY